MSARSAAFALLSFIQLALQLPQASAQVEAPYQTREERMIYNNGPERSDGSTILDATNPMELINKIRQATAMENATLPSDAIDQALQEYQQDSDSDLLP